MLYLEKLTLYMRISCQDVFIDPISLLNQFSKHMSRLYSFKFYINTANKKDDLMHYLSNNYIKEHSMNIRHEELSNTVCFLGATAMYNVFTIPFEFTKLMYIGSKFPNIIFNNVIELWVHDEVQFEHEFFLRIAQAFPLLKCFYVSDLTLLPDDVNKLFDNVQLHKIVEYPHLTSLNIIKIGTYYVEQFLNETKTHLPCLAELRLSKYEDLRIVTKDFTRAETRQNCANVTRLIIERQIVGSKDYHIYFPLLYI